MILTAAAVKESFGHRELFGPMADERYFLIPMDYLVGEFLPFWARLKATLGMEYRPGRTDCDDFATVFKAEIIKAALSLDTDAAPAVGIAQVHNFQTTLGIPDGNHRLNFAGVLDGKSPKWLMIEPITDRYAPRETYLPRIDSLDI
jgi:hypothetical protein